MLQWRGGLNVASHSHSRVRLPILASRQRDRVHDRAPVAGCGDKHECVPDRILEPEASPNMEGDAEGVQQASKRQQEESRKGQRGQDCVIDG